MQEIIRYYPSIVLDILYCYSFSESMDENPHKQEPRQQNHPPYVQSLMYLLQGPHFYKPSKAAILIIV